MKKQIFNTIKTIKKRIFNQKRERIKKRQKGLVQQKQNIL